MKKSILFLLSISFLISSSLQANYLSDAVRLVSDNRKLIGLSAVGVAALGLVYKTHCDYWNSIYKNWDDKTLDINIFPEDFKFGVASSAPQFEADCIHNTWSPESTTGKQTQEKWEQEGKEFEFPGNACDLDTKYKDDIAWCAKQGFKFFRFSIEWSKIEPKEGTIDKKELARYGDMICTCIEAGIQPVITMHHYTDPIWFFEQGGFEKEANIKHFVNYCALVFEATHEKLQESYADKKALWPIWLTFNSPTGYAAPGYLTGDKLPFKKDMALMVHVLKNLLFAHVEAYKVGKSICDEFTIGIMKNIHQIDPARWWHPLDRLTGYFAKELTSDCIYRFFNTGRFKVYIPGKVSIDVTHKDAPNTLDIIGLNYYSHRFAKNMKTEISSDETPTNNENYTVYPEGFYRALHEINNRFAKRHNIKIIVTENGIGTQDGKLRETFMRKYLYALSRAIKDGVPVIGYCYWALLDNWEWGTYAKYYGIRTRDRKLKPGSQYYLDVVKQQSLKKQESETSKGKERDWQTIPAAL